jgi:signal transduction histidine kinase/ActR/RegA family two-component response regulator
MIGQSFEKLVPPEQRTAARHNFERVLTGEVMEPFETLRITRDQRLIEVSAVSSLIRSIGGTITGVTSTERDISRLKDTERRLLNADQQKNEFLAMLGHELRNPLSSMRTAAELLKHCATDDPEVQYAQEVFERQTAHMAKLLDGLLDVSRIVHGKISLDTSTVDFVSVCREVLADSSERAVKSGLTIKVDLPRHPLTVEADRLRLVQIVDNILSNALRYTPRGGSVQLSLREEHGKARLTVNDDGVGIERDVLPRIFDVFWQSRQNLDRARGGLGIGLSLVRTLAELHGGEIDARSEGAGRGAEFTFRMPISSVPIKPHSRARAGSTRSLKILIIEDNRDSADMISKVLARNGHVVTTRYDGTSGMECARLQRPDVVLCDLGLPDGITGYDIARELSGNADTSSIKLIALSGYGEPEVKTLCLEIGFRIHLTKPVSVDELMNAVSGVAGLSPA